MAIYSKIYRAAFKTLLHGFIVVHQLGFSANLAYSQADLVTKIYLDFKGNRPSASELAIKNSLAAATSIAEKRQILEDLLKTHIFKGPGFERRLSNYFNGVFSTGLGNGSLLSPCDINPNTGLQIDSNSTCFTDEEALDFRDEMAMMITRIVTGNAGDDVASAFDANYPGNDIRNIVLSSKTVITPRMAERLLVPTSGVDIKTQVGYGNIDLDRLNTIKSKASKKSWYWIDRDPLAKGLAAGPGGSYNEKQSGILTMPAYLLRGASHLARANQANSWLLCRNVYQVNAPESTEQKLVDRAPCSGCHTILEPLGSFFVNFRSKVQTGTSTPNFVLSANDWTANSPVSPASSVHSLKETGSFRGVEGRGVHVLAETIAAQKDFGRCMAQHAWQFTLGRGMLEDEAGWADLLGERLASVYNWDLRQVIIDIVLSTVYSKGE